MSRIPPQKIGFYFEKNLPSSVPTGDDFSFIYIKEPKTFKSKTWNKTVLYLGIPKPEGTPHEFVKLTDNYVRSINSEVVSDNGNIDLGLNDIVAISGNIDTDKHISIGDINISSNDTNSSILIGKGNVQNFKEIESYNSIIISPNFNADSYSKIINQSFITGFYSTLKGDNNRNLMINLGEVFIPEYQKENITWEDNIFIGGIPTFSDEIQDKILNENTENINISGYVYIKNFGIGHLSDYFKLIPKLQLATNTEYIQTENDVNSLLVTDSENKVKKISPNLLRTILGAGGTDYQIITHTDNSLKPAFSIISNSKDILKQLTGNYGVYNINFSNSNTHNNSIIYGQNIGSSNNSTIIGYNIGPSENSTIVGKNVNNTSYKSINLINYGDNNLQGLKRDNNNNTIFGSNNLKINRYLDLNTKVDKNKIFGDNNLSNIGLDNFNRTEDNLNNIVFGDNNITNGGNNNIIFGNDNFSFNNGPYTQNNIIFGNWDVDSPYNQEQLNNLNNIIAFGHNWNNFTKTNILKYADQSDVSNSYGIQNNIILFGNNKSAKRPLMVINPEQYKTWIESKLILNYDYITNSELDVTHNKLLTIGQNGEVGYVNDTTLKRVSTNPQIIDNTQAKLKLTGLPENDSKYRIGINDSGDLVKQINNDVIINFESDIIHSHQNTVQNTVQNLTYLHQVDRSVVDFNEIYQNVMKIVKSKDFNVILDKDDFVFNTLNNVAQTNVVYEKHPHTGSLLFHAGMNNKNIKLGYNTIQREQTYANLLSKRKFDINKNWIINIKLQLYNVHNSNKYIGFGLCAADQLEGNINNVNINDNNCYFSTKTNFFELRPLANNTLTISTINQKQIAGVYNLVQNVSIICIDKIIYFVYNNEFNRSFKFSFPTLINENSSELLNLIFELGTKDDYLAGNFGFEIEYVKYMEFTELELKNVDLNEKFNNFYLENINNIRSVNPDKLKFTKDGDFTNLWKFDIDTIKYNNIGFSGTFKGNNTIDTPVGFYLDEIIPQDKDWIIELTFKTGTIYGSTLNSQFGFSSMFDDSENNKIPNILNFENFINKIGFTSNINNITFIHHSFNEIKNITKIFTKIGNILKVELKSNHNNFIKYFYIDDLIPIDSKFTFLSQAKNINSNIAIDLKYYIKP